ncbi:MAG: CpsD/CapB family tyrosine-protein kinase [Phycisphaerae bacterium]
MGNVYDAMRRHESEQAEPESAAPGPETGGESAAATDGRHETVPTAEGLRRPRRPRLRTNGYAPELVAHNDRGGSRAEEYRALRTNLLAQYEKNRFCILVTSAEAAEGKTVTCLNLGFVLAELPDRRTVVVDCDLQKSHFNTLLGTPPNPGVADVLRGEATPEEALHETTCDNLLVMPAGEVAQEDVGELISRPELEDLVSHLRKEYDYVLLDTPPIRVAGVRRRYRQSISYSTAGILGRTAKDALVVVRMNKTKRESVEAALRQLKSANVRPVGLVLTHQRHVIPELLYRLF